MEVALHRPVDRLLDLAVGQRVARVFWLLGITQKVREQEQPLFGARRGRLEQKPSIWYGV